MLKSIRVIINLFIITIIVQIFPTINLFAEYQISQNRIFIKFKSQADAEQIIPEIQKSYVNSQLLHLLARESAETYNPGIQNELQSINYDREKVLKAEEPLLRTYILEFANNVDTKQIINDLQKLYNGIERVEPSYIDKLLKYTPNDPLFSMQSTLDSILPEEAWEIEKGNSNIVIAISDNGVPQTHPDLVNSLFINTGEIPNNNIDDDHNGYIDDYNGFNFSSILLGEKWGYTKGNKDHGSIIAGIIGATFNNSIGIAGIAGKSKIFPIKASDNSDDILYGTESIVFAGVHQFSVLNLSWGSVRPFSEIEQNAIDYAVARGVAIVAAAGNVGSGTSWYDTFYPAGCRGVLGVGEVDGSDYVVSSSSLATCMRIFAPGQGNLGTGNNNDYINAMGGTSFSAPVISGAVALARSKYPNLSPMQALEFVRLCTDDIKSKNIGLTNLNIIPGRVNLLKIVSTNPMSIPAIVPNNYLYYDTKNVLQDRFNAGDTVLLKIDVTNLLGAANTLKFTLSIVNDPAYIPSLKLLDSVVVVNTLNSQENKIIGDFKFIIAQENLTTVMFRLDIEAENNYHDFVRFNFLPTKSYKTFETDKIKFSLGDAGEFGFVFGNTALLGDGFAVKGYGNQIYGSGNFPSSGVMISNNSQRVVSIFTPDFYVVKKFVSPDENVNIFNDDYASSDDKIGVQVQLEKYKQGSNFFDFKVTLTNINSIDLNDIAFGYYIDFDVADDADSNQCEYYSDIITNDIANKFGKAIASEITYKPGAPIYCAVVAYSDDINPEAQAAGLDYDYTELFEKSEQIATLNSGITMQSNRIYDRSMVVGMKFLGALAPNETRQFHFIFAGDTDRTYLTNSLSSYLITTGIKNNQSITEKIKYIDYPETNELFIQLSDKAEIINEINIYDILGRKIQMMSKNLQNQNYAKIMFSQGSRQIVLIEIITNNEKYYHKFILK
ncbi:MAG TPA: S8 family serine peptidase [Candidatus Kapabacteria bacterium]|nr:S8 family serine peptidase [Candidatus Kapabacteria bacterium]